MGNRALRKKVGELLKGSAKLYRGNKLSAYRALRAKRLRTLINDLQYGVGDLIHDCDGFNFTIKEMELIIRDLEYARNVSFVQGTDITLENGNYRCPCSKIAAPTSREQIEGFWKGWLDYHIQPGGWGDSEWHRELKRRLDAGEHICDEQGRMLPELDRINFDKDK